MCNYISYYTHIINLFYILYYFLKLADRLEQIYAGKTGISTYVLVFHYSTSPAFPKDLPMKFASA